MTARGVSAALLIAAVACSNARFVDKIIATNPTPYSVNGDVTSETDDGWLTLGTASPSRDSVTEEVIDYGEVWIFRFSYLGREIARERVSRAVLKRANWRISVPASVEQKLREQGFSPPPTRG
jgi:hypothetical protein